MLVIFLAVAYGFVCLCSDDESQRREGKAILGCLAIVGTPFLFTMFCLGVVSGGKEFVFWAVLLVVVLFLLMKD